MKLYQDSNDACFGLSQRGDLTSAVGYHFHKPEKKRGRDTKGA